MSNILHNKNIQQRDLKDRLGRSDMQTTNLYSHTSFVKKITLTKLLNSVMSEEELH